jgi:hypothetical protein
LNLRPLAYGNTASIKGTTTLTTKPNALLQQEAQGPGAQLTVEETGKEHDFEISLPMHVAWQYIFAKVAF